MTVEGLSVKVDELVIVKDDPKGVAKLAVKEDPKVLSEKDTNTSPESEEAGCCYCKKTGPNKRRAKRHPKCIKKLFCNETCEQMAHKKKDDPNAAPKPDTKKADAKKKKAKGKKENGQYGESCKNSYSTVYKQHN